MSLVLVIWLNVRDDPQVLDAVDAAVDVPAQGDEIQSDLLVPVTLGDAARRGERGERTVLLERLGIGR
jgi:hypothetical protein